MVGRWISFWDGNFSGFCVGFGRCTSSNDPFFHSCKSGFLFWGRVEVGQHNHQIKSGWAAWLVNIKESFSWHPIISKISYHPLIRIYKSSITAISFRWYCWWFRNPKNNHLINVIKPQLVVRKPDFWLPSTVAPRVARVLLLRPEPKHQSSWPGPGCLSHASKRGSRVDGYWYIVKRGPRTGGK